jgi:hypothetical protein
MISPSEIESMPKPEARKLLKTLNGADITCNDCGCRYGRATSRSSTMWRGVCDLCGKEIAVTETRDYGYFRETVNQLYKFLYPNKSK